MNCLKQHRGANVGNRLRDLVTRHQAEDRSHILQDKRTFCEKVHSTDLQLFRIKIYLTVKFNTKCFLLLNLGEIISHARHIFFCLKQDFTFIWEYIFGYVSTNLIDMVKLVLNYVFFFVN